MSLKFILSITGYVVITLVAAIGLYIYLNYHTLAITFDNTNPSAKVELYRTSHEEATHLTRLTQKVGDVASGEKKFLKDDIYAVKTSGSDYSENIRYFSLKGGDLTYGYTLSFSKAKLDQLRDRERAAARAAITAEYPALEGLYEFEADQLLLQGDWYVASLSYRGPERLSRDRLRVVAYKQNDEWKSVTKPQITLGAPEYPTIPVEVLDAANREMQNPE